MTKIQQRKIRKAVKDIVPQLALLIGTIGQDAFEEGNGVPIGTNDALLLRLALPVWSKHRRESSGSCPASRIGKPCTIRSDNPTQPGVPRPFS